MCRSYHVRQNLSFSLGLKHGIGFLALTIKPKDHIAPILNLIADLSKVDPTHHFPHFKVDRPGFANNFYKDPLPDSDHSHFHHPDSIPTRRSYI